MPSISEFDYDLPNERIAQTPVEPRDSARLLDATGSELRHRHVADFASLVGPGDVVVFNDSRVIPARLALYKSTGGAVEVFLLEPALGSGPASSEAHRSNRASAVNSEQWKALVRPSRRVAEGTVLNDGEGCPVVRVGADLGQGIRIVTPVSVPASTGSADVAGNESASLLSVAHRLGSVPLPPYITAELSEPERYQTVYSRNERSVAAPTAGLHFSHATLEALHANGAQVHTVDLAVGIGTFRPIVAENLDEHQMHGERFEVAPSVLQACSQAERVIAVGTTTVRALESAAQATQPEQATQPDQGIQATTELFITPGYDWKVVDVLFTNFHQPRSSLLVMLAAFAGERWRHIYDTALAENYRFLSFGDAMIVNRQEPEPC